MTRENSTEPLGIGAVVIGRNEGERLVRCLDSLVGHVDIIVYVDSGSCDDSVENARQREAQVVELDSSRGFTMARARNAGFRRLMEIAAELPLVQFVDGDCEIEAGWLEAGERALREHPGVAAVCGAQVERHPEASIYHRLAAIEWSGAPGDVEFCGGIVLMRADVLRQTGGYEEGMIAGEDPELCVRIRKLGYGLRRIDAPMMIHDIAMSRFSQWWRRTMRGGHAFAEQRAFHGSPPECLRRREVWSNWLWGLLLPVAVLVAVLPTAGWSLLGFLLYPVWVFRIARRRRKLGDSSVNAWLYGLFVMIGKIPMMLGQIRYWESRWLGKEPRLIEHKHASGSTGSSRGVQREP